MQVFSCEVCEVFKDTHFEEHLQTASSVLYGCTSVILYWILVYLLDISKGSAQKSIKFLKSQFLL